MSLIVTFNYSIITDDFAMLIENNCYKLNVGQNMTQTLGQTRVYRS